MIDIHLKKRDEKLPPLKPGDMRYVVGENGVFLERRTALYRTCCRVDDWAAGLQDHQQGCELSCPKLPAAMLADMLGFFRWAFKKHGGESALVLLYKHSERRFEWHCPPQHVNRWETSDGRWITSSEIRYEDPAVIPPGCVVFGDAHSHGDLPAYASHVDQKDETYKDGVHIIAGYVDWGKPQFHIDFVMDGQRFNVGAAKFFEDADVHPNAKFPGAWREQVDIVEESYEEWAYKQGSWQSHDNRDNAWTEKP